MLVGEDPDGDGTCLSVNSWHIDKGTIDGVDVADLTITGVNRIPGNVLKGNWKVIYFVDDRASPPRMRPSSGSGPGRRAGR